MMANFSDFLATTQIIIQYAGTYKGILLSVAQSLPHSESDKFLYQDKDSEDQFSESSRTLTRMFANNICINAKLYYEQNKQCILNIYALDTCIEGDPCEIFGTPSDKLC